jgi:hypothetical protein
VQVLTRYTRYNGSFIPYGKSVPFVRIHFSCGCGVTGESESVEHVGHEEWIEGTATAMASALPLYFPGTIFAAFWRSLDPFASLAATLNIPRLTQGFKTVHHYATQVLGGIIAAVDHWIQSTESGKQPR